jgi:predicted HTH transcriptional regulator
MPKLPSNLDQWNLKTITQLVKEHSYEPGQFDFKEVLNSAERTNRNNWNAMLAKAAGSMANADGGYLIFGVADSKTETESPEDRMVGIPMRGDHRKEFGGKVEVAQPAIHFDSVPIPIPLEADGSHGIFVVQVPLSARRPHMIREQGAFYTRGDGGSTRAMDFYEIRDQRDSRSDAADGRAPGTGQPRSPQDRPT